MPKGVIALGSDHASFKMKEAIKIWLEQNDYKTVDCGTHSEASVDYSDYIYPAALRVRDKEADFGIVMCGTGLGASYTANKVHGIRAALCQEEYSTEMSRLHNDANVLVLGGRILAHERAITLVKLWLNTPFEGGRHGQRIAKLAEIELSESRRHR